MAALHALPFRGNLFVIITSPFQFSETTGFQPLIPQGALQMWSVVYEAVLASADPSGRQKGSESLFAFNGTTAMTKEPNSNFQLIAFCASWAALYVGVRFALLPAQVSSFLQACGVAGAYSGCCAAVR